MLHDSNLSQLLLNSFNLLTDKVVERVPWTIYRPDEKTKKAPEIWKWTLHERQYLKSSNINLASISEHVRKKLWDVLTQFIQFTVQQINLKSSRLLKKIFIYMSVLNTFQHKQYFCILKLPKCIEYFLDQKKKLKRVASGYKEIFCQC